MRPVRLRPGFAAIAAAIGTLFLAATPQRAAADDQADAAFAARMFAGGAVNSKSYACFVRRYDAEHLAQHPLQKVSVMKLLITAEKDPDDPSLEYSFRLGVNYRDRPGDFDSSGDCGHAPTVRAPEPPDSLTAGIDFFCGVDCDGGGISVNLANNDNALMVKLDRMRIWKSTDSDDAPHRFMEGGADDKVFRLDRVSLDECRPLVTDRKELAAMRSKK